jgi:hypothetical protein
VDELKCKLREEEASEARPMAGSRDSSREDSQAQSQIDQMIGMVWTLERASSQAQCTLRRRRPLHRQL